MWGELMPLPADLVILTPKESGKADALNLFCMVFIAP